MIIRSAQESDMTAVIEITPMIDMVFLLLVFFLVATTFHQEERDIGIALPAASSGVPVDPSTDDLIINLRADGHIVVNGRILDEDRLRELIASAVERNPKQKITVRGDREAAYGQVINVLDICKAAGIEQPFLDTLLER